MLSGGTLSALERRVKPALGLFIRIMYLLVL
jgi:hypothetical protein